MEAIREHTHTGHCWRALFLVHPSCRFYIDESSHPPYIRTYMCQVRVCNI